MKLWLPVLVVLLGSLTAAADQRIATWSSYSSGEGSGAVDCRNCPEDEYIRFFCPMNARGVEVKVIAILLPETMAERASIDISFNVDGQVSVHPGTVGFSEMFGAISEMTFGKTDPVFDRLRKGSQLTVSIGNGSIDIPLTGSNAAIEELLAGC